MYRFLAFIAVVVLLASCSQSNPTASTDTLTLLRSYHWRLSSGTVTLPKPNGKDTTMDYMQFVPACHKDDYIKFDSGSVGAVFPGSITCSAADADSLTFIWRLFNNGNNIDLLSIFNLFYVVQDSIILPYYIDTLSTTPTVVLDTIIDSPVVELDTIWKIRYDSLPVSGNFNVNGSADVYGANISNISKSGFTLSFRWYGVYADSIGGHEGGPPNYSPLKKPDTIKYILNYVSF